MIRRNGNMGKVVVGVCIFFAGVYMIYLYNDVSGQLKNTERTAERYRREQETVSAQLQDLAVAKTELKTRCDNDKQEMTNRLNSLNQQYRMLKSQHEDMEVEFGRIQNERETQANEHKKMDEERALEYNQFKQEKSLEITSLKDSVANLEREKVQLTEEIKKLKSQLQNSLLQVNQDKETIATLKMDVQNQKLQLNADQRAILQYRTQLSQAQNLVQQAQAQQQLKQQQQLQQQQQQNQNLLVPQGSNNIQQQQPLGNQNLLGVQQQGVLNNAGAQQGLGQQGILQGLQQHGLPVGGDQNQNIIPQQQGMGNVINKENIKPLNAEGMDIANEIMKSLQDKHKPVDADVLEEQQKQHQIVPPQDPDKKDVGYVRADLGHEKHAQNMLGQDGHDLGQQHQIGLPNLGKEDDVIPDHGDKQEGDDNTDNDGAGEAPHDNRIDNQGPVNLQVQEPAWKVAGSHRKDDGRNNLMFRPNVPEVVDSQIQPQHPVDDTLKLEQMVKPMPDNVNVEKAEPVQNLDKDDDDENYDDEYDKGNDKEDDEY